MGEASAFDESDEMRPPMGAFINQYLPPAIQLLSNFPVESYYLRRRVAGKLNFRDAVYRFLADPISSLPAYIYSWTLLALSFTSVVTFCMASARYSAILKDALIEYGSDSAAFAAYIEGRSVQGSWFAWECFLGGAFTVEFIVRMAAYTAKGWRGMMFDPMLWVDALALIPLLLRIGCIETANVYHLSAAEMYLHKYKYYDKGGGTLISLNAAFSSLRLLRTTRFMVGTKILMQTLRSSLTALIIPSYLLFMLVTFFGTILFAFEYDPYDYENGSRVQDVGSSWWMVLVTMTTVGYGDYSPQSTAGKLVMGFIMIVGVTIIAMPIAIVGNNFSRAWEMRTLTLISQKTKASLLNNGGSPVDVVKAFAKFDENGSGACSYEEFKHAVTQKLGLRLSGHRLRSMWRTLDTDESGHIKFREFAAAMFPEVEENTLSTYPSVCKDQSLGPKSTGEARSTQPGSSAQATTDTEQRLQMLEVATNALTSQQQALQRSIDELIGLLVDKRVN